MQNSNYNAEEIRETICSVLYQESGSIANMAENLTTSCAGSVQALYQCQGRVIVTGMGKMSAIARKTAATLCSVGTPAVFLHPAEALHGDLGIVSSSDVLLALSNSGETRDLLDLIPFMKRHAVPVISITGTSTNSLARVAEFSLITGVTEEADSITEAPTNSTTSTLALCDGLAIALVHLRGFTVEQFAVFHPAGKIGRKLLLRVEDLMTTGNAIPQVDETASLREAIVVISRGKIGAGFVVDNAGQLVGIVTDGDLRRILERDQNPLDSGIASLMTANPRTLQPGQLAAEALGIMNQFEITAMPVLESNRVIGALHLHDLLRAGLG